jgi:hypothetical protein
MFGATETGGPAGTQDLADEMTKLMRG